MADIKHTIELACVIPISNINFYKDVCQAMNSVNSQYIKNAELKELASLIDGRLKPQPTIEAMISYFKTDGRINHSDMKILGRLILNHVLDAKDGSIIELPLSFLTYALIEDSKSYGKSPHFSLVEEVLNELAELKIINPAFGEIRIKDRRTRYNNEDIATIYLGYSFASHGALLPIVSFPALHGGFVAFLSSEWKRYENLAKLTFLADAG
jgi:hypothetical protein